MTPRFLSLIFLLLQKRLRDEWAERLSSVDAVVTGAWRASNIGDSLHKLLFALVGAGVVITGFNSLLTSYLRAVLVIFTLVEALFALQTWLKPTRSVALSKISYSWHL